MRCLVITSLRASVNDIIMEMLIMCYGCRTAAARRIIGEPRISVRGVAGTFLIWTRLCAQHTLVEGVWSEDMFHQEKFLKYV